MKNIARLFVALFVAMLIPAIGQDLSDYVGVPETLPTTEAARKVYNLQYAGYISVFVGGGSVAYKDGRSFSHELKPEDRTFERLTEIISSAKLSFQVPAGSEKDRVSITVVVYRTDWDDGRWTQLFRGAVSFQLESKKGGGYFVPDWASEINLWPTWDTPVSFGDYEIFEAKIVKYGDWGSSYEYMPVDNGTLSLSWDWYWENEGKEGNLLISAYNPKTDEIIQVAYDLLSGQRVLFEDVGPVDVTPIFDGVVLLKPYEMGEIIIETNHRSPSIFVIETKVIEKGFYSLSVETDMGIRPLAATIEIVGTNEKVYQYLSKDDVTQIPLVPSTYHIYFTWPEKDFASVEGGGGKG